MPKIGMFELARCKRSRYGKENWQTGQLTLKKASTIGNPSFKFPDRLILSPFKAGSEKSGALVPGISATISGLPPKLQFIFLIRRSRRFVDILKET